MFTNGTPVTFLSSDLNNTSSFTSLNAEYYSNGHAQNSTNNSGVTVIGNGAISLNNRKVNQENTTEITNTSNDKDEVTGAAKTLMSFSHNFNRNTITKRKHNYKNESSSPSSSITTVPNVNHTGDMKLKNYFNQPIASTLTAINSTALEENQHQLMEPPKILMKDLNKEERLRLVKEKREQELAKRKKEIEENLKRKEELREKQLQDRKRRIDELKLKENSKHLAVGERRKKREELARVSCICI